MLAVRKFLVWAPALIAVGFALAGLTMVASQQSNNDPGPILREAAAPSASRQIMIDFNSATAAELATLPGIGLSRANAIVLLRAEQQFGSLADLVERGILRPAEILAISDLAAVYVTPE